MSLEATIKWRVSMLTPKAQPQPQGQIQGIEIEAKAPGSCLSPGLGLDLARPWLYIAPGSGVWAWAGERLSCIS